MISNNIVNINLVEEQNLIEYLQAEIIAIREKKEQLSAKNSQLVQLISEQEQRLQILDIF